MKKTIIMAILVVATGIAFCQSKPKQVKPAEASKDTIVYRIYGDKDLNFIYEVLSAGYQGVNTSDNFSVNARKDYAARLSRIDSILRPQIKKYHPEPVKKP